MNRIIKIDEVMRIYKDFKYIKDHSYLHESLIICQLKEMHNISINLACKIVQMGRIRS